MPINKIQIPKDWTGQQAVLVLDFLEHLIDTIWAIHKDAITATIQTDIEEPPPRVHASPDDAVLLP